MIIKISIARNSSVSQAPRPVLLFSLVERFHNFGEATEKDPFTFSVLIRGTNNTFWSDERRSRVWFRGLSISFR